MKKSLPLPLQIDCSGLSKKRIADLTDRLRMHFKEVIVWNKEISAGKPLSKGHYEAGWRIIDRCGVKAA